MNEIEKKKTIQKINTTKNLFFETINKIDKSLARFTKEKREKTQTESEGEVTTDTTQIQMTVNNTIKGCTH